MNKFKNRPLNTWFLKMAQLVTAILIGVLLLLPTQTAEANFFDIIKDIYHLPENVENLQNQYEEAKKNYDETKQQVEEQMQQLLDQKNQLEDQKNQILKEAQQARETEERLTQQNQELLNHNSELQTRIQTMEETVSSKDKWLHRIKVTGITLVSLVLLYFVIGRLFRIVIWQRNNKRARLK